MCESNSRNAVRNPGSPLKTVVIAVLSLIIVGGAIFCAAPAR